MLTPIHKHSLVFLSTYPPRECGIATFTQDLVEAITLQFPNINVKIAAINQSATESSRYPANIAWQIDQNSIRDYRKVAHAISIDASIAAVIIQHEYGIHGGVSGAYVLDFLSHLKKPVIIALHTILSKPSASMRQVTQALIDRANHIVVMSQQSLNIIKNIYEVDPDKISYIAHGIHPVLYESPEIAKISLGLSQKTVLSTFGLLSRNKGIEFFLQALPPVVKKFPNLLYLVLGSTHPIIRRQEGESYRLELLKLTEKLGLKHHVIFYDQYFPVSDILAYLQGSNLYNFTSLDPEQSVSGTLSYALGTGRPVLTTAFVQANEMITPEIGRIVPMKDVKAYTSALLGLLKYPHQLEKMGERAYFKTRSMLWTNVAEEYMFRVQSLLSSKKSLYLPPINLLHFDVMTDDFGMLQFAHLQQPDNESGYTLDDNARALMVSVWLGQQHPYLRQEMSWYINNFIKFIDFCQQPDGSFVNYIAGDQRTITDQNYTETFEDGYGRTIMALASLITSPWHHLGARKRQAERILNKMLPITSSLKSPRSLALIILGLHQLVKVNYPDVTTADVIKRADQLVKQYENHQRQTWHWFMPQLTYANGILPAALFAAAELTGNEKYLSVAVESLDFLIKTCFFGDIYVPIGQKRWFIRDGIRSLFDQQPEDPSAMMIALQYANRVKPDPKYVRLARKCFSWYLGNNLIGKALYDPITGGCADGLTRTGINLNEGAESLLSYLTSRCIIEQFNL